MKLDPKVYRGAASRILHGLNIMSCVAVWRTVDGDRDANPSIEARAYSREYERFTCQDGKPCWWDVSFTPGFEERRLARIAALEAFASYLERTGGEL